MTHAYFLESSGKGFGQAFLQQHTAASQKQYLDVAVMERIIVPFLFYHLAPIGYLLYLVNHKDDTLPPPALLQAAHSRPAIGNPSAVRGRNIVGRKELIRHIQILKHLLDHGRFAYLTGTHHHLDELPWLFHPVCNYLIFRSFIHTITFYSVD